MAEIEKSVTAAVTVLLALLLASVAVGTVTAQPDCSTVTYDEGAEGNRLVEDVEQLQCITEDPVGDYRLDNNIDAGETFEWNDGTGFEPIGVTFRGTFDGDGYSITSLFMNRSTSEVGLFASTSGGAVVENVVLENAEVTGEESVGGLVGHNEGVVRNSRVTGTVTGLGETSAGGVVGRNVGGVVTRSSSSASVFGERYVGNLVGRNTGEVSLSYTDGRVRGDDTMGGIVGYNLGTVHNSYSTVDAEGRVTVAGLVGRNRGRGVVRDSYAAGRLRGTTEVRGLVAANSARVEGSYYDVGSVTESPAATEETLGTGLTTDEMTGEIARDTMSALDFGETWVTVSDDYPILAWQTQDVPSRNGGSDEDGDDGDGSGDGTDDGDDGVGDGTDDSDGSDDDMDGVGDGTDDGMEDGTGDEDEDMDGGENETQDDDTEDDETDDETDGSSDNGGEGLPGFGVFVAVAALVAVGLSRRFVG